MTTEGITEGRSPIVRERDLRVAVVGAGWMGEAHLRAYAARQAVRIVALVTHSEARGAELAARYPIERIFSEMEQMLDVARPEGISVTTREHDHLEPALAALERGVGVLVEKPMASRAADAIRMAEAARRSGSLLVPAHILRFAAPHQALHREVKAGRIGSVVAISARRDRTVAVAERYDDVHPALLTSVHDIDQVLWLTGAHVRRVRALQSHRMGRPQPESLWAHLELDDGSIASLSSATLHPSEGSTATSDRLEVYGSDGVAAIDVTMPLLTFHARTPVRPDWLLEPPDGGGAFGAQIGSFCTSLRTGQPAGLVTPDEAVEGIRVAEAMIRSATDGGTVVDL